MPRRPQANVIKLRTALFQLLILATLLFAVLIGMHPEALEPAHLRDFILSFGLLAPLVYGALYLVAVFIPYATTLMTVAAGLAFGTLWGAVLTYSVTTFASLIAMAVSRYLGRPWVEPWVGKSRARHIARLINQNAFLVFFYLRLLPTVPYEIQNYIAGVSRITYPQFVAAGALGNAPSIFIMTFLGDSLTAPGSNAFWLAAAIYIAALLLPVLITLLRRKRGQGPLPKVLQRIDS